MATPKWNKNRQLWIIQGKKNGMRKNFYSSVSGLKGKREVQQKYDDWLDFGGIDPKITVARCVELYLQDIEARLGKKDTYKTAEQYCRLYVVPTLGKARMNNLTLRDWQAVLNEAKPYSGHIKTLSKKTLLNLRGVLASLHRFAYENYYCDAWRGNLYIPQGHSVKEREILQPEDIRKLFEPSELWYHPCFLIMLLCGLRPSEALGLQVGDVGKGVLYIRRGITDDGRISTELKTKNARRIVPLPSLAEDIIRQTIERNDKANYQTEWIFCGLNGEKANQNTMRKHWNRLKAERGIPGSPYSLRHTFVSVVGSQTNLAEGTIKDILGHSDSMPTFSVYKHQLSGELESAASIINLTFERLKAENS